jgi:tetratricopeptide (TPR) repeat protein
MGARIIGGDLNFIDGQIKWRHDGHPNRATLVLQKAIDWRPNDFRYYHTLAGVHFDARRYAMAEQSVKLGLERHPNNSVSLRRLAQAFYRQNKLPAAIRTLNQAIALDPLNPRGYKLIAQAYTAFGEPAEAVGALERALELNPGDRTIQAGLWPAYQAAGQLGRAVELLEELVRLDATNGVNQGNLGLLYLQQQRLGAAESSLIKALEGAPLSPLNWHLGLVQVYSQSGRRDQAWQALKAAEAASLDHPRVEQARQWLEQQEQ